MFGDLYDEESGTLYEDDNTRCVHGTYIGTPGGPDFMCGACESGEPAPPRGLPEPEPEPQWSVVFPIPGQVLLHENGATLTVDDLEFWPDGVPFYQGYRWWLPHYGCVGDRNVMPRFF